MAHTAIYATCWCTFVGYVWWILSPSSSRASTFHFALIDHFPLQLCMIMANGVPRPPRILSSQAQPVVLLMLLTHETAV